MAAFSFSEQLTSSDTSSHWRPQAKKRVEPKPSLLNTGGFLAWTDVPKVGVPDPHTREQLRQGRITFPNAKFTPSGPDPYSENAGKRVTSLPEQHETFDSKFHFPHLTNARSRASGATEQWCLSLSGAHGQGH